VHSGDTRPDTTVGGADLDHRNDPGLQRRRGIGDRLLERDGQRIGLDRRDQRTGVTGRQVHHRRREHAERVGRRVKSHPVSFPNVRRTVARIRMQPIQTRKRVRDNDDMWITAIRNTNNAR
jgi:hypothetical protein